MEYTVKPFQALSTQEFYEIAKLRIAVFVVEQACPFQEIDDTDAHALHAWLQEQQTIVGYARIIQTETDITIGRVVIHPNYRGQNLGHRLLDNVLHTIDNQPNRPIFLDAQAHLTDFYAAHGFVAISQIFLIDNIPHVRMRKAS